MAGSDDDFVVERPSRKRRKRTRIPSSSTSSSSSSESFSTYDFGPYDSESDLSVGTSNAEVAEFEQDGLVATIDPLAEGNESPQVIDLTTNEEDNETEETNVTANVGASANNTEKSAPLQSDDDSVRWE